LQRFITGALHLNLDKTFPPVRTTGTILEHSITPLPEIATNGELSDDGKRLETTVRAARSTKVTTLLKTGSGHKLVTATVSADFENSQIYDDAGAYEVSSTSNSRKVTRKGQALTDSWLEQHVEQTTWVVLTSYHDGQAVLRDVYSFPLSITTNYSSLPSSFSADLPFYGYNRALTLPNALNGGEKNTEVTKSTQQGWAMIVKKEGNFSVGFGEMEEKYRFSRGRETYTELIKGKYSC